MNLKNRWKVNRSGFFNFWKHEETELVFEDGKMLLHGPNGSGKTMSMTSLITPVLDGKTTPERLDPFESRSRKMRDVLLGKQNAPLTDSRVGYLFLEYRKGDTNQYVTTIVGLEAVANKVTTNFWGCIILDNRRVGNGLNGLRLYKIEEIDGRPVKVPLSKKELEHAVGASGLVVNTNEEYMSQVNKYLFGFASNQKFQDYIKLLIQLRTPKLSSAKSTGIKPSTLNEILRDSLPEITIDDLRPLIETIETIDSIKLEIDQQKADCSFLKEIAAPYERYNDLLLYYKARNLIDAYRRVHTQSTKEKELKNEIKTKEDEITEIENKISKLKLQYQASVETIQSLQSNQDVFSLQAEQAKLVQDSKDYERLVETRTEKFEALEKRIKELQEQLQATDNKLFETTSAIEEELEELQELANLIGLLQHDYFSDFYIKNYKELEINFTEWNEALLKQEGLLKEALGMAKELEQLRGERSVLKSQLEELETERREQIRQREELEKRYEKQLHAFIDDVNNWANQLQSLNVSKEELAELVTLIESLYFTVDDEDIHHFLGKKTEAALQALQNKLFEIKLNKHDRVTKLKQLHMEIKHWESGNEPEPPITDEKLTVQERLSEEGIQYLPLYKAVEFVPGISLEAKAGFESAMLEAGVLDALIVGEKDEAYVSSLTAVIKTNGVRKKHNVTRFLSVSESALYLREQVIKALEGISIVETEEGYILESGQFSSSFVYGQAQIVKPRFLGREARIQYRERLLQELKEKSQELKNEVLVINKEISNVMQEMTTVKEEREEFPAFKHLKSIKNELGLKNQYIKEHIEGKITRQLKKLRPLNDKISLSESNLRMKLKDTSFREESSISFFNHCLALTNDYKGGLKTLEYSTASYYSHKSSTEQLTEWIDTLYQENDALRGEIKQFQDKISQANIRRSHIEEQLAAKGADEIAGQLKEQLRLRIELPGKIEKCEEQRSALLVDRTSLKDTIIEIQSKLPFAKNVLALTEQLFTKDPTFRLYRWGEKEIIQQAKELEKDLREKYHIENQELISRINQLEIEINTAYNKAFKMIKNFQANLERVMNASVHDLAFLTDEGTEDQHALVQNILHYETRTVVTMTCIEQGVELKYSPQTAIEKLELDIQMQELRMSDKDQELYEKFLLQDLRKVIRDRIQDVGFWVLEMNRIMGEIKTSSKLSLNIKWVPISGETEEEIHTRKLVKLFSIDSAILNADEKEQVIQHFRSKITRKLQLAELNGERIRTFKEVIHEVFDYRNWFNFEIHAKLKGEDLGHLTNKVYYGLSGGEKALSMYIPLLAAVYSRYAEASPDCPRIITLDEAFAGVDDHNISEIFGMLKQMDFDYIYNSQSLWGCYPSVPSLAIYDFHNTEDSDEVILFRYRWNGVSKEYLGPVKPAEELRSQLSFRELLESVEEKTDEQSS